MTPELSITTRSSLLERVKHLDDEESWREFARVYSDLVRRLAVKAGMSEHDAEDILQEVLLSVARNIGGFKYNPAVSSFRHWITKVTRWRVADQRKRRMRLKLFSTGDQGQAGGTDLLERIPGSSGYSIDAESEAAWGRTLVEAALDRVKQRVSGKDYQIYFLHVLRETPVPEVCRRLNVNRGQVYLAKHRVAKILEKEFARLRRAEVLPSLS